MTATPRNSTSALAAADPADLRRLAQLLRLASQPIGVGVGAVGLMALGIGGGGILALRTGTWGSQSADLSPALIVALIASTGGAYALIAMLVKLAFSNRRSREIEYEVSNATTGPLRRACDARRASRAALYCLFGSLFFAFSWVLLMLVAFAGVVALVIWHVLIGKICGEVADSAGDAKLSHARTELRRKAWVLLAEVVGFPLVLLALSAREITQRYVGVIGGLLIAFAAYVLWGLVAAARRAANVCDSAANRA